MEGASFCHSSVQFGFGNLGGGTTLAMPGDRDELEPSTDAGFTVFALTKADAIGSGAVVSKAYGAANNWWAMMSTVNSQDQLFWLNAAPPAVGGAGIRQVWTDTNRWVVWAYRSETVNATLGTRILSASRDDSGTGFVNGGYVGATTNTWTGVVNNTDGLRFGAANGFVFRGQVMDVTIFPRALTNLERSSMFQWYDSFYHLTCPTLNSENATNGEVGKAACAAPAARHWAECRQSCTTGWVATYGTTEHQCLAGEWSNSPLVCERVCPTLAAPVNYGTCRRTLMELAESTSLRGQSVALFTNKWAVRPAVPRALRSSYWNIVDANTLFTGEPAGTKGWIYTQLAAGGGCARAVPSFLIIDRPLWQTAISFNMLVSVHLEVRFVQGVVGIVGRWLDENNHIRVQFNQGNSLVSIVQVVNGISTDVSNVTYARIGAAYGQSYTLFGALRVDFQGSNIRVFDDTPGFGDGLNVLNGTVTALRSGTFGLGSAGTAAIRRFAVRSDCDGAGSCLNAAPGTTCSYQCGAGFREVSGARDYTCGSDGAWSTSNLICSINPPSISSAPKTVRENALDLATVGLPVDARSDARGAVLRFNVTRTLGSAGAVSNLFGINECSGQLFVAPGALIDYEANNLYTDSVGRYYEAEVQAIPNQDSNAAAFQNVKVYVQDVNEAARFAAEVVTVSIPENAAVGTAVTAGGTPYLATDPDTLNATFRNNRYILEVDAFPDRTFVVNPLTGIVTLNRSNTIDFETQPDIDLRIRVEDVLDDDLLSAYTLRILITDVNEPPIIENPFLIEVDETQATGGAALPKAVVGRDPENAAITYSIDTAITANNNNLEPANVAAGPLFSINSATGALTWLRTITFLPTDPTKVVDGRLVREVYHVYVAGSDGSFSATSMVKVYLMFNASDSALPTITGYSVQTPCVGGPGCVPELPATLGQQTFTLTGTNFIGTPPYSRVVVNLTEYDASDRVVRPGYSFRSCVIVSTTTVRCSSPPGVGTGLRVEAFFFTAAGLRVPASYTTNLMWNYEAPVYDRIDNATGYQFGSPQANLHLLSTSRGGRFYASGKGFGLEPGRIIATFGKVETTFPTVVLKDWWTATVIATNGTYITLEAPIGGFGTFLRLKLVVGGQTFISQDWQDSFGYRPPRITAITLPTWQTGSIFDVPTDANGGIVVRGIDMPPAQYAADGVTWNQPQVVAYYGTITQYPNGCTFDSLISGCYMTDPCNNEWSSPAYTAFFCWLPFAGSVGANLTVTMVIRDHEGDGFITTPTSVLTANPGTFGHRAPILNPTGVTGLGSRNADTAGGQTLSVAGFNLGPLGLSQETWGTIGIRLVYGNRLTVPFDPRNPATRYQYQARNCRVVFADAWAPVVPGPNGRVECDTDEGTGINHAMRIAIGGQWSNEITSVVSYGAPIISSFSGQAAIQALTSGLEPIIIQGRNFGRWIERVNVSYVQNLDQDKILGLPGNFINQPIFPIGSPLRFTPANCSFSVNHTALLCFTSEGAGGNLKWFATVDGQLSRDPFSSYGPPQVFNITVGNYADQPGAAPANALSPETPPLLYVIGQNFGRPWPVPYVFNGNPRNPMQWCRYVNAGQQQYLNFWWLPVNIIAGEYFVESHTHMRFQPRAGYGQNLYLEMMVGDQESGRTQATFSFVQPRLLYITPQNGTTKSDVPNQYRINLFASDLPFTDLTVEYYLNIGNAADGSRVSRVICTRNPRVFGSNIQSLSCPVPSGSGRKRLVRLTFDRPGVTGSFVTADGFATFDYRDPVVAYTSADAANNPDTASFPSLTNTTVENLTGRRASRIIYVYGSNLGRRRSAGTPQDLFGDSIIRDVMVRNKTGVNGTAWADEWAGWTPIAQRRIPNQANVLWEWTDDWVIFFTNLAQSEGRLRVTARDIDAPFGNGTVQPNSIFQWSNIFDFSVSKPTIDSLEGIPAAGFSTSGGDVLTVNVPWSTLAGGATKMEVEIGSPVVYGQCGVLNRASDGNKPSFPPGSMMADRDTIVPGATVSPHLVNSCRDQYAQNPRADDLCKFYCRLPPTRGGSWVPVLLNVDDSRSNARHIYYHPPEVAKVTVIDNWTGLPSGPTQVEYNLLLTPTVVVSAPTTNATLIIEGTDFGDCPTIVIGTEEQLFHRRSTCERSANGGDYSVPAGDRTHTRIVVPVPPGQGSRYPNGSWPFKLIVRAGGPDDFQDNMQPSGDNVTFAYQAPVILAMSPTTASTRGEGSTMVAGAAGTLLSIVGRNFGEAVEIGTDFENDAIVRFTLNPNAATDPQAILCANVTRVDHFRITCNVPEGSGGGMTVQVQTLDTRGNSPAQALFSYERPRIDNVVMQVWEPTLYDAWPASWQNRSSTNVSTVSYTATTGATGPTPGRYLVRINGRNFGPRVNNTNCVMVPFNTAVGTIDCANPLNFNQILCKCPTKIRTGDLTDPDCNSTTWWELMGRPATHACDGSEGRRGEGEVFHDAGARVEAMQLANPEVDVVGTLQGMDIFGAGFVVSWSHEMVEFLMPPGMGDHIITVLARNQYPILSQEVPFSYARPEITGLRSLSGAISTGPANNDILEISGRNMGFSWPRVPPADFPRVGGRPGAPGAGGTIDIPPWNSVGLPEEDATAIMNFFRDHNRGTWPGRRSLAGIRETDYFPGATVTVKQWNYCLSTVTTAAVLTSPAIGCQVGRNNKNHTRFNILMHTHNRILFRSHPGVGVDRRLEVIVHNTAALPAVMARSNTTFSYDMPMPFQVDPQRLEVPRNTFIDITGFNFGDRNDEPFFQFSTPEEDAAMRQVRVVLDDLTFIGERSENSTVAFSSAMGKLETDLAGSINLVRVGKKDMFVRVAGQSGVLLSNDTRARALHVVCNSGYFGRLGESCLICPPGSTCLGFVNDNDYPRNMSDYNEANLPYVYPKPMFMFYNMNASDRLTAGMAAECPRAARNPVAYKNEFGADIQYSSLPSVPLYSARDVCIVGCVPPEACGGDNYCTDGYMSKPPYFRCGSCAQGFYRRNLECVKVRAHGAAASPVHPSPALCRVLSLSHSPACV